MFSWQDCQLVRPIKSSSGLNSSHQKEMLLSTQISIMKLVRPLTANFYFPSKKFFGRKIFNSVGGIFFPFLEQRMTRRLFVSAESLVSCITEVSGVNAVRKPELAGSNPAIDHIFNAFLGTRCYVLILQQQKLVFFHKKSGFLVNWFFS